MANSLSTSKRKDRERAWWKIGNKQFLVRIANYERYSDEYVTQNGTFSSGSPQLDSVMAKKKEMVWRTISQLVKIWERGGEIIWVNHEKDTRIVHEIIQEQLADFADYEKELGRGLSMIDAKERERLRQKNLKLDQFGREIYHRASKYLPKTQTKSFQILDNFEPLVGAPEQDIKSKPRDYVPITEVVNYSGLSKKRSYRR